MASFFRSAFEKLSNQNQERIAEATEYTALQVSPNGDLFGLFVEMRNYLKAISEKGMAVKIGGKDAKKVAVASKGIGEGMKLIAEAINALPPGKEAQEKMNAIVTGVEALSALGGAIFKFAAMLALSLPLLILGIPALMIAVPMILVVGGLFYLLGEMNITGEIKEVATGLAIAGLAMVSLAAGLVLTEMILSYAGSPMTTFAMVSAVILGTALIFGIAGVFSANIKKGAMTMILAAVPLILISAAFAIFSAAVPPTADGWETIGQVGAAVTGLGLLMAAAGLGAAFIIPGAAAMILAGGALISIAAGLSAMAAVMKPGAMDHLFADSGHATKPVTVMGITILEGGRPMSNLEWALLSIGRSFMLPPLAIAGMYAGAPALIMAGVALMTVAKGIEKFQALDIDYDVLPQQIAKTTNVLADAFAEIGEKYPGGGGGIMSALFGAGSDTSIVAQGISAVSGMGRALTSIALGIQNMALLKYPVKWDKNGNPIEFRELTEEDFDNVGKNTKTIVLSLSKTFAEVGESKAAKGSTWFSSSNYEKGINTVRGMGEALGNMAEAVQNMVQLKMPIEWNKDGKAIKYRELKKADFKAVSANTRKIVLALSQTFSDVGSSKAAEGSTWFTSSDYEKGIKVVSKMGDPLKTMSEFIKDFSEKGISNEQINDVGSKTELIIRTLTGAFMKNADGSMVDPDDLEDAADAYGDMADYMGDMSDAFEDFADTINDLELEKVVEVRKMYEALASLSTSGSNIVQDMSEAMIEAIEMLAEKLGEFSSDVKSASSPSFFSRAVDAVSGGGSATEAAAKESGSANPAELIAAIKRLERALSGTLPVYVTNSGGI